MRVPRRGADAWICSWDAPHNKPGTAQYPARLVSHAHQSAGPLQPASGCCSSSAPSPVLQGLGLPLSGEMGPCIHRGPDYMSVFTFWVTTSWGSGSFKVGVILVVFLGGELHLKSWKHHCCFNCLQIAVQTVEEMPTIYCLFTLYWPQITVSVKATYSFCNEQYLTCWPDQSALLISENGALFFVSST